MASLTTPCNLLYNVVAQWQRAPSESTNTLHTAKQSTILSTLFKLLTLTFSHTVQEGLAP